MPNENLTIAKKAKNDEFIERNNLYLQKMKEEEKKIISENSVLINNFMNYCSKLGLKLSLENFKYFQKIGIVLCYPNIVQILSPEILIDKEGLTNFNILLQYFKMRPPKEGSLYTDDFVILVHPYFRRGFYENNNYAPRFVELFWMDKITEVDKYIAIDRDRIRIDVNGPTWFERDTWYGPKFNKEISKIEDGVVHLRPTAGIKDTNISFFFNDAYSLDVKWGTQDRIKTFQSEEFKTERVTIEKEGEVFYPARYIHAEYDLDEKYFRHFDGAVHLYRHNEYLRRRDSDLNYNIKNNHKIKASSEKLFKFNGKIKPEIFIEYSSHFMSGNPLVHEYFEGNYPDFISEKMDLIIEK